MKMMLQSFKLDEAEAQIIKTNKDDPNEEEKVSHIQFKSTFKFENDTLKKEWEHVDGSKDL